jgi:proteic killer suppression protein
VPRYITIVILSFNDSDTEEIFNRIFCRKYSTDIKKSALRKLVLIHGATDINDLRVPPGNRLEALKGERKGQHSIRINDQFRICFVWNKGNAFKVELVDYH